MFANGLCLSLTMITVWSEENQDSFTRERSGFKGFPMNQIQGNVWQIIFDNLFILLLLSLFVIKKKE